MGRWDDEGDGERTVLVFGWTRKMGRSRMGCCVLFTGLEKVNGP